MFMQTVASQLLSSFDQTEIQYMVSRNSGWLEELSS